MYFGFLGILSLRKRAADKLGDSIRRMADGWADMIQYKYARADAVMDNRMQWSNKNTMVDNMHKHAETCTKNHNR